MPHRRPCALCCTPCALCHTVYAASQPQTPLGSPAKDTQQPLALGNLLPAGTITVRRASLEEPALCDHAHADDGWHVFNGTWHSGYLLNTDNASFCAQLGFLAKHEFIAATYNVLSEDMFVIRIYLIPIDLPNVRGRLHHANRKDSVLLSARRYLRHLIPIISQDHDRWHAGQSSEHKPLIYAPPDGQTLAEIYSDLASPRVDPSNPCTEIISRFLDPDDDLRGFGFRSTLYQYQRRSIAAMLTRELDSRAIPDPLYLPVTSMDGGTFYFQPGTSEVMNERGMVAPTRGGLLCEELGTGKTVMILGLILSTLKQLPSPPDTITEPPPILTPIALKTFPSAPFDTARRHLPHSLPQSCTRVPSLVELMLHRARTAPVTVPPNLRTARGRLQSERLLGVEEKLEMTILGKFLTQNAPFYFLHPNDMTPEIRPKRSRTTVGPRTMYLSSATLVVVPSNLLSQWDREITKHCDYPLRVLVLRSKTKIPPVKALATDYDIILMTYTRYTAEAAYNNISKLHNLPPCSCPNIPGLSIPECNCPNPTSVSPLLQIRWKRLVIDEGHVSASLSTNLTPFTKLLNVERRWIVTGTPTTNLLGLNLGKDSIAEFVLNPEDETESLELQYPEFEDDEVVSSSSSRNSSLGPSKTLLETTQRVWTKYDREDLYKLDNMITHFVAVPHFIANPKLMQTHVREPLMDRRGPRPGSIQVLNQVMEMIMIRHRVEDVEKDIVLPPVIHESILLDLDPMVIKSYNALQASIAINAIDSQRTDQDYMFHPRNSEFLQITVKNLSQLMFWSVDDNFYNVDQLVQGAQATLERALSRNMPPEDIQLVQEALRHVESAAADPLWRRMQTHEDVPYRVSQMPDKVFNAWTRTSERDLSHHPSSTRFLHADRLLKLHDMIMARPLANEDLIAEKGAEIAQSDLEARKTFEEAYKRSKNKHTRKYTRFADEVHTEFMVENAAKKAAALNTLKEMQKELDHSLAKLERELDDDEDTSSGASEPRDISSSNNLPSILVRSSILAGVTVGSSASSKLNYVINEVMHHSAKEKILIFSESELTLAHVAEALELIHVKFLRFTTQIQPQVREQLVLTFETSETYRVFLMELKHGARGLNLISASRVIFCEPVWQADVESQAIKRVHRIGQTRSISVKTLGIRGTAEENMVERRNLLKGSHDKIPKLLEESGMRHFIANPKFLTYKPEKLPEVQFPLIHAPRLPSTPPSSGSVKLKIPALHITTPTSPSPAPTPPSQKRVFVEDPINEHGEADRIAERTQPKKKKTVHFG